MFGLEVASNVVPNVFGDSASVGTLILTLFDSGQSLIDFILCPQRVMYYAVTVIDVPRFALEISLFKDDEQVQYSKVSI